MDFFEFSSTEFVLFQNRQAEIIIVKRLIQGRNNVIRFRVEPRSCDQHRRKNDAVDSQPRNGNVTYLVKANDNKTDNNNMEIKF